MNNMYRGRNQMSGNMNQPCSSCRNAGPNKKDDKHDKEMNSCPCHKDGCDIGTAHVDKMEFQISIYRLYRNHFSNSKDIIHNNHAP